MIETIEVNWLIFGAALVAALLALWWLFARASKPAVRSHKPDVLDAGVGPAQRNQALIDAAPAAQIITPPPAAGTMAGVGEVVAAAAQDVVEEAEAKVQETAPPPPEPAPLPTPIPRPARPEPVEVPPPDPSPELPDESPQESPPPPQQAPEAEPLAVPELPDETPAESPPPQQRDRTAAAVEAADDLSRIKGLGPKLQALLPTLGITSFAQIAAWSEDDLARIDPQLGPFAGRPVRDGWIEQAKLLAAGDVAGFEDRFGKV
jgi:predicted flap endonuclease-1-like 5' DNA nuclease